MSRTGLRSTGLLLAGLWVLLATTPASARDTQYSATVPVADRSEAARGTAVRQALGDVLIRLSGDPAILQQAGGAALVAKANRYLQQYQYEGIEAGGALQLRAGFDGAALEVEMHQQGLPLWGRERPLALDQAGQTAEQLDRALAPSLTGLGTSQLTLRVEGVTGLADYARISQYLSGLGPVRSVALVTAQAQRLEFLVDVQGGAAGLEQTLARDGILEHAPTVDGSEGVQSYRLRP